MSEREDDDGHGCHIDKSKENKDKVPTLYWIPKINKKPYKAIFIANLSFCSTTELSKVFTSCLTAGENMSLSIYKRSGKNLFLSIKNSSEISDRFKAEISM